jgi:hypothetical protein
MTGKNIYLALTGDLRRSRRAEDRAGLQRALIEAVQTLNELHSNGNGFAAPLAMTAGDAVQCLLNDWPLAFSIMHSLSEAARPSELTFGLGMGTVSTDLDKNVALIDGPAFHTARAALEQARSDDAWAAIKGYGEDDDAISAIMYLMGAVRRRWTDRQVEFVKRVGQMRKQTDIAREMGVSVPVVSKSLKAAAAYHYWFAADALRHLLSRDLRSEDTTSRT